MYNAWLIAFLLLPEELPTSDQFQGVQYSKQDIMTMLLLHDLPKAYTGDLLAYNTSDSEKINEYDEEMQKVVFSASFTSVESNLRECALWNEWRDGKTYNSLVAHDINQIQAVFQYSYYRDNGEIEFESKYSYFSKWIEKNGEENLKTDIGKEIAKKLGIFSQIIQS